MNSKRIIAFVSLLLVIAGGFLVVSNIKNGLLINQLKVNGINATATVNSKSRNREVSIGGGATRKMANCLAVSFFYGDAGNSGKIDFLNYQGNSGAQNRNFINTDFDRWITKAEWDAINQNDRVEVVFIENDPAGTIVLKTSFDRLTKQLPYLYLVSGILIVLGFIGVFVYRKELNRR